VTHVPTLAVALICQSYTKLMCLRLTFHYACLGHPRTMIQAIQLSATCVKMTSVSWETVHRRNRRSAFHVGRDRPQEIC